MRVLILTQYFWPESFRINDMALGLKERGHEVTVLTGIPNYPKGKAFPGYGLFRRRTEYWNGMKIHRVPIITRGKGGGVRLFINYFSFAVSASFRALYIRKNFDVIFVFEPSPITVGIPAIVLKWVSGKKYHFWVQDLWPATVTAAAGIKNKLVIQILDWLTKRIYHSAATVLAQSKGFMSYIKAQGIPDKKILYLPNSTESMSIATKVRSLSEFSIPQGFNLLFAGNIGSAQSFHTLLGAAIILKNKKIPVNWVILGDGRMRQEIQQKIIDMDLTDRFFMLGRFPIEDMPAFYASADALLLSLRKDEIFSLTIPTKLQSYLAFGKPVIASIDGEGARVILEANAGYASPAEDTLELAKIVERAYYATSEILQAMGKNGKDYYEKEFKRELVIDKLESILKS